MWKALGNFVTERAGSLVSKKLGATAIAEATIVGSGNSPIPPGTPTLVFIAIQGILDGWKYYVDKKYQPAPRR